jgi:metal-responsive CopG/Arc/MetJ family transcriptional regulator
VFISCEDIQQLDARARAEDRSRSEVIRDVVSKALEADRNEHHNDTDAAC